MKSPLQFGLLAAVAMLALSATAGSLPAESKSPQTISAVEIGFQGLYKVGHFTPCVIELDLSVINASRLEVWTEDSDGARTRYARKLPPNTSGVHRETLIIKPGRREGVLRVVLRDDQRVVAERDFTRGESGDLPLPIPRGETLILSLGECASIARALDEQPRLRALGTHLAQLSERHALPTEWIGYEGVDFVLLLGSEELTIELFADPTRLAPLELWLQQGGSTVFSLATEAEVFAEVDSPRQPGMMVFQPGDFVETIELRDSAALETFASVSEPLLIRGSRTRSRLSAPKFNLADGEVVAADGEQPLVVRQTRGFGEATFVAIDLNNPILEPWSGTAPLISRLLFPDLDELQSDEARSSRVTHLGYDDLTGQLRSALGQFQSQGVRFLPFGIFAGLLVLYLAIIGPGDYFLVKRLLPRMEFTWLTFSLAIVLFCAISVGLARWSKGDAWRQNKVDLVDVDMASGFARGRTWFALFSPATATFDLELPEQDDQAVLTWLGLPGGGLGGMESTAAPPLFAEGYDVASGEPRLDHVPLQIWSTKTFTGTWFPEGDFDLKADLRRFRLGLDDAVEGTITNHSGGTWNDAVLLFDRWVIPLGTIDAGQQIVIDERTASMVADQYFTRRRQVGEDEVVATYDRESLDVPRIVEMIMFHRAAGGQEYTQLKHQADRRLDFTRFLSPRRAILVVRTSRPAIPLEHTDVQLAESDARQWTFYRYVIPVAENDTGDDQGD